MNSSRSHNFLLIGLVSTGKTSFLAALWYAVQQTQAPTGLVLKKLDGDSKYLNKIRDAWLEFKPVGRNQHDIETYVSMHLKDTLEDDEVHLTFPDLSGEAFKLQWTKRQLTTSYDSCLRSADGGILFIHPSSIVHPLRITEIDDAAALIDEGVTAEQAAPKTIKPTAVPWDIEKAPTQVQLIELLQFMMRHEKFKAPFRLAIAISAWDLIKSSNLSPRSWVVKQLPMLDQFLASNRSMFEIGFYGVSAQGGDYEGNNSTELQNKLPARRIEIVGDGVKNAHDITEPLQWLMR